MPRQCHYLNTPNTSPMWITDDSPARPKETNGTATTESAGGGGSLAPVGFEIPEGESPREAKSAAHREGGGTQG